MTYKKLLTLLKYYKSLNGFGTVITNSSILDGVFIEKDCIIKDTTISKDSHVFSNCFLQGCSLNGYNRIGEGCSLSSVEVGRNSYIADKSVLNHVCVGKYSSIGPNVKGGFGSHPLDFISTSPFFYSSSTIRNPLDIKQDLFEEYKTISIGNDVWIGANVFIKDGINIGNGAVVAAGSVLVKDVPEYAIVGGVPGKVIRFRFSDGIIELIKKSKWWDMDIELLKRKQNLFQNSIKSLDDIESL